MPRVPADGATRTSGSSRSPRTTGIARCPRRIENYVDFAHFAWVHDGVLGDRNEPEGPRPRDRTGRPARLRFDHPHMAEPPDSAKNKGLDSGGGPVEVPESTTGCSCPSRSSWTSGYPSWISVTCCSSRSAPTGPKTSRCFTFHGPRLLTRRGNRPRHDRVQRAGDRPGTSPSCSRRGPRSCRWTCPPEVQIKGSDRVAVEYRRWLKRSPSAPTHPESPSRASSPGAAPLSEPTTSERSHRCNLLQQPEKSQHGRAVVLSPAHSTWVGR